MAQPASDASCVLSTRHPGGKSIALRPAMLSLAIAAVFTTQPGVAQNLPTGAIAIHGQASISAPSAQQLLVTTQNGAGSNHSAINWQSFSIAAGSSARINQPSAASLSINRVVTNTPSALLGNLSSNGRLVLVNPAGITVGAGAVVDTAGFTASALRMTDADALAGRLRFGASGGADAMVGGAGLTVGGRIVARDGDVVLIAPQIGVGASALMQAPNGSTILAAGQQVEITGRGLEGITMLVQARDNEARNLGQLEGGAVGIFAGTLRHSGQIQATTATLEGGTVVLQASGDAIVEGAGSVLATGQKGGRIDLLGQRVGITDQALIDASGTSAGGSIRIGGDFQGNNESVPNADKTALGPDTRVRADAQSTGNGGRIIVWADDATQALGHISARGGDQSGDGGFVEVSGKKHLDFQAQVDLRAPQGSTGTLLLDPFNITIGATADINGDSSAGDDVTAGGIGSGLFPGANSLITATQVSTLLNTANLSLAATNDITVAQAITKTAGSAQTLTLNAGNAININAAISSSFGPLGINLTAGGDITVAAPIITSGGNFTVTGTGSASTMRVSGTVNAAVMAINLAGALDILAGASTAYLLATGNQTISASGILMRAGASGLSVESYIVGGANQTVTVGSGGLTLEGGGGIQRGNAASLIHDGGSGTSQVINVNGGGNITLRGGSSSQTGVGDGNGSHASIGSDSGGNQTITFGVGGGNIELIGGTVGSNAFAEIYAGTGVQTITGASLITLRGGASGGNPSSDGTLGNIAVIDASANSQSITANEIRLQGGAGGLNNLAGIFGAGNQTLTVGAGGLHLTGGGGGINDRKNAALVVQYADNPLTSQTITIGGGGNLTLQGGTSSAAAPGSDANLLGLSNGSFAGIRSDGVAQLIEFTAPGSSLTMTGGTMGDNNLTFIQTVNGSQTIRGTSAINAPTIVMTGGASGGFTNASTIFEGNQALISTGEGDQAITAASIQLTGGAGLGGFNRAEIQQGFDLIGSGNTQTVTITDNGALNLEGGSGNFHLARIRSYGATQTVAMGANSSLDLSGGTGANSNFARIDARVGDQFITGSSTITINGGAAGGTASGTGTDGNFADIRQRNATKVQSISADTLTLTGGDAGTENGAFIRADGAQTLSATGIALQGGLTGTANIAQINAIASNQILNVGASGLSLTGGGGSITDRRNYASVFQGGTTGISQTINVSGGGNIALQGGNSAGTSVGADNGSLAFITNQGDSQLLEFTGTGSAITITGGSVGSLNGAGIISRNGSQTIRGDIAAHAPSITLAGGSGGVADEGNGAQIGANTGLQTISAKAASLNGGSGVDSFATITAPNQNLNFDGNVSIAGGTGTGTSPGARLGGRGGVSGTNTNLNLAITGNLSISAGPTAGGGLGSTGLAAGLTNDITATIGGAMTMTPSAGAGVRIGSRFDDVQGGTVAITAGSLLFTAGDGANNVAGIRTTGNVTLATTTGGITEAVDTNIRANLLTVSSAGSVLMDSLANQVASLSATVPGFDGGNIFFANAPGALLTLTGITMAGSGSQTARITADDIDIAGAVSNVGGMVILRPRDLARNTHIETTPTAGVLSLSPAELQLVSNAAVLEIGRLDGTGNLSLVNGFPNNNNNVGMLRLLAGQDFFNNSGASIGDFVTPFNQHLQVRANRHLQINSGNLFLANNRNLQLYADDDGLGGGDVSLGSTILGVGVDSSNTSGSMDIKGSAINVAVTGGASASLDVFGAGNQTLTATAGDLRFDNNNTGSDNGFIAVRARNGTQSLAAGNLVRLQAGGGSSNSITVSGDAGQTITAGQLQVVGGVGGSDNFVQINGGNQTLAIGAGGIALTGGGGTNNFAQIYQSAATGAQSVSLGGDILVSAGSGSGGGNRAQLFSAGTGGQSVNLTTGGAISVTGGAAGFSNYAGINAQNGNQSITGAGAITISGGLAGGGFSIGNRGNIGLGGGAGVGNQSVSVGAGGLLIQGGGGTGNDQDNSAFLGYSGAGTQTVTIAPGGNLMIVGGSSTKLNVGGGGHGSRAGIDSGTNASAQQFVVLNGGNITLMGGSNGSRNYAGILADSSAQSITGATNITLTAGSSGGVAGEGNRALFNAGTSQVVSATNITINGGGGGTANTARIGLFGTGALTQSVTASNALTLSAGGGGGGFDNGNAARIQSDGSQTVTAGAGGIALTGGGGLLSDNQASIYQRGTTGTGQTVRVTGGGSISLLGGTSAGSNVGGFGHGSFATIEANGDTQLVDFVGGGTLTITGGSVGSRNLASIYAPNGNQTISGVSAITLQGGANGGFDGEGNSATIYAAVGSQTISASASITVTGGANGIENSAQMYGEGAQTISASGIALSGGAGGGGFSDGNRATIRTSASQLITVQAGGIQLAGGGGSLSDNDAQIGQLGSTGSQTVIINNGSVTIQGGTSVGTNVGGTGHGSRAQIYSEGTAQSIQFTGTPGSLSLTGGTVGSRNFASIFAGNTGSQTISGAPVTALTGGASGGFAGEGNYAAIGAQGGVQTVTLGATTLTAGAAGIENSVTITAPSQSLTVNGNLNINGGGGSSGARIGGLGDTGNTSLSLNVIGGLALNGGSGSGAAIGSSSAGSGLTNTIVVAASGDVTLTPSTTQAARIGSPGTDTQGGGIFITAGGTLSLLDGGGSAVAAIRSLGDVTLSANLLALGGVVLGNSIFAQGDTGVGITGLGSLTANASTGESIEVVAASGAFTNTAGSGALNVTAPARWLVYSNDPANDARGGLSYDFKQYNKVFGDTTPIAGTGDGFLYTLAPTATVSLTGVVSKGFDGTDIATLSAGNFQVSGGLIGDTVSIIGGATGSYDTRNVGTNKNVSINSVTIAALDGATPVFGYGLAGGTASGLVGTITAAPITVSTAAVNKSYDATTAAPGASALLTSGALVAGDLLVGGSFAFLDANAGTGKTVTVSGATVNDGNGGNNYSVSYADNTSSSIGAASVTLSTSNVTKVYDGTTTAAGILTLTGGSLFGGDSVGGGNFAFTNKNAGIGNKTITVGGATVIDGNGGANYVVNYVNNTTSTINPAGLTLTADPVSRTYDGTIASTGTASVTSGALFSGDTLGTATLQFDTRNVGGSKSVSIVGAAINDGNLGANYNLTLLPNLASSITPASLVISTNPVNKEYNGLLNANGVAVATSGTALFGGDTLSGGSFAYTNRDVGLGDKSVTVASVAVNDGNGGGNYSVSYTPHTTSSITQRAMSSWTGLAGDNLWSSAANWDALPDGANVRAVTIPGGAGTIALDVVVNLLGLTSGSPINQVSGGSLASSALNLVTQGGATLSGSGNQIAQLTAANSGGGDLVLVNGVSLLLGNVSNSSGNITITNTGGVTSTGPVNASGDVSITALSPLTIGTGGVAAGRDIFLTAGNKISPGPTDNLTLNGAILAGNTVDLYAGNNLVQNFAVVGANRVTAQALGSFTFGPLATTNHPPIFYTAGGVPVTPPPTVLASSLQEPGNIIVTFRELLQQAIDGPPRDALETNADGSKKDRDLEGVVTEGDLCR